jgi:hypothetical protein
MTLHGMHCAALSKKTIITGTVARFSGMDNFKLLGGTLDRGIGGSGIDIECITKTMDLD